MMFPLLLLALLLLIATADPSPDQCGLYMAVSSTSTADELQWGLYLGHEEQPKGTLLPTADLAILVEHLMSNAYDSEGEEVPDVFQSADSLETVLWVRDAGGAKYALNQKEGSGAYIGGAGGFGAFNAKLTNSAWNHSGVYFREPLGTLHDESSTPFYNVTLSTTQTIAAGSEVFVDFGENWEDEDKESALSQEEFTRLDATIDKMIEFFEKHPELDDDAKNRIYKFLSRDVILAAVGQAKAARVQNLLPSRPEDLPNIPKAGGLLAYSDPAVHRTLDWLNKFGLCMDNVRVGPSEFGRGAIAQRDISMGKLVAPTPVAVIPNGRKVFELHPIKVHSSGDYVRASDEVTGHQLLLNYAWGHPQSDILLVPMGSVVTAINHSPKPNAHIVWSDHPNNPKQYLETADVLDAPGYTPASLVMEVRALKDIAEGEEVTIDYGAAWQKAWDRHKLQPPPSDGATFWNAKFQKTPHVPDAGYPAHVQLKAHLMVAEDAAAGTLEQPKTWSVNEFGLNIDSVFPMEIVNLQEDSDDWMYLVKWTNNQGLPTFVKNVPHTAIFYVDTPVETTARDGLFRHEIHLADDVFPDAWKTNK